MAAQSFAAQTRINRAVDKRGDGAFIERALASPEAKVLALVELAVPIVSLGKGGVAKVRWIAPEEARRIEPCCEFVFLGQEEDGAEGVLFACNFPTAMARAHARQLEALKPFVDLRSLAVQGVLSLEELLVCAQARALLGWHAVNVCCGRCGGKTVMADGGWKRICFACRREVFPRTDPVVMMLITDGDRCLLGAEHRFAPKLYSALAGFVEAGDDIEHAVRREVMEETGVVVGQVRYVASQPWPFPHSLIIGCWGEALSTAVSLDTNELRDARWFSRKEAAAMIAGTHPDQLTVPPPISIAHELVARFVRAEL